MIAMVHSIYSQSVHALALNTGSMDTDTEWYCKCDLDINFRNWLSIYLTMHSIVTYLF